MRRRLTAALLTLVALSTACGRGPDADSDRVIASPLPSGSIDPLATNEPKTPTPRRGRIASPDPLTVRRGSPRPSVAPNLAAAAVKVTRIATLDAPLAMATRKGDDAFYIAEKGGRVRPVRGGQVGGAVLDISSEVSTGGEQGLLGLAFSPDGDKLYVNFTTDPPATALPGDCGPGTGAGDTVIREYDFDGEATSPREVLRIRQPYSNHNGGNVIFGPDGYLYIGMGDGGSGNDPDGNAQDLDCLLGKMLRIDPRPGDRDCGEGEYSVPDGNPFAGKSGCDEIWAYGLRNPWRYSFDRSTDALWIGDVGQSAWEEIDVAGGSSDGAENYGWDLMEGNHGTPPPNHHGPIYEYANGAGNCSVTGGYVYRGSAIVRLRGAYVFADFCAGRLRAFVNTGGHATGHRFLGPQVGSLASFGQDRDGELYVLSLDGGFYRIDPA